MTRRASIDGLTPEAVTEPATMPVEADDAPKATVEPKLDAGVPAANLAGISLPSEFISHSGYFDQQLQNYQHGFTLALEALVAERDGRAERFKADMAERTAIHEAEQAALERRIEDMSKAVSKAARGIGDGGTT